MSDFENEPKHPQPPASGGGHGGGESPAPIMPVSALVELDVGKLLAGASVQADADNKAHGSDLLHLDLASARLEIAGFLALAGEDCADEKQTDPLLSVGFEVGGDASGNDHAGGVGGEFLARVIEAGTRLAASATGLATGNDGAGTGDDGHADCCQCAGLLQSLNGVADHIDLACA